MAWKTPSKIRRDTSEHIEILTIAIEEWEEYYKNLLTEERRDFKDINYKILEDSEIETCNTITMKELRTTRNGKSEGPGGFLWSC